MRFNQALADVYVPGPVGLSPEAALARTTHLCVGAHQDDIEIMAYHGIAACFGRTDRWFSGVVVTDGGGCPRSGRYAHYTDEEMRQVRAEEQRKAARVGDYSIQIQLAHPSAAVKQAAHPEVQADLRQIFAQSRAEIIYLHQPADKHDTHVALLMQCLTALRSLPAEDRPRRVLGCEVWRDLDWMVDEDKHPLPTDAEPHLAAALVGVFDSQIAGGKRYDLATAGRRLANATFHTSHATDRYGGLNWAMDLTPLVANPALGVRAFAGEHLDRFRHDVDARLARFG